METVLIESTDAQVVIKIDREQIASDYLDDLLTRIKNDLARHHISVNNMDILLDGQFDTYQATMPVLARDWDSPENDHWDNY